MEHPDPNGRNDQSGKVESGDVNHSETHQDEFTEVYRTPNDVNIRTAKITMPLMGTLTIAEVVQVVEETSNAKVILATLTDGIVTLTIEDPYTDDRYYDVPECPECGQSLDTEFELKNGRCASHD